MATANAAGNPTRVTKRAAPALRQVVSAPASALPMPQSRRGTSALPADPASIPVHAPAPAPPPSTPPMVRQALHSPGRPLDTASRQFMEPRLRHDFSAVQVHSDAQASASANALGALAYTYGSHIVFAEGHYLPATPQGRMLLAHELAHVVQQDRCAVVGDPVSTLEAAADRAAAAVLSPGAAAVTIDGATGPRLLCQNRAPLAAVNGTIPAMTPEDMYNKLIAMRGFDEAIPVAKLDATKEQLAKMEAQLKTDPNPELRRQYNKLLSQYNISTFEGAGGPAGQGYNTYAIVQVVGPDGKIIAVADGKYTGGLHAEQIALQKIDAQLGGQAIPGSRIDVVSDRTVCPGECVPAFKAFAEKYNVGKVDAHVFRRQRVVGTGVASEKTTARTATKQSSEGLTPVRQSETIVTRPTASGTTPPATTTGGGSSGAARIVNDPGTNAAEGEGSSRVRVATGTGAEGDTAPRVRVATGTGTEGDTAPRVRVATDENAGGEGATRVRVATDENEEPTPSGLGALREGETGESVLGGAAKGALKSAAVSIGTGVAMSILQEWFKQKVLDDLAALPQPRPDKRTAHAYLTDPKTKNGVRILDILAQNLGPFSTDLANEQAKISATRFTQLMVTAVMPEKTTDDYEKKLHRLDSLQNDLDAWEQELLTIDSNLDALLELQGQLQQTARAAQDLKKMLSLIGVADELLKMGFSYEEYIDLLTVLDNLSSRIWTTLADAQKAKEAVRKALDQTADFDHQVNQLWWKEFGGQVNRLVKDADQARRQAQQRSMQRTKIKYGSLEGLEPLHLWNSDQQGMWYSYKTRESEILFELNELTKGAANSQDAFNRKVALEAELGRVRQKMIEMRSGAGSAAP